MASSAKRNAQTRDPRYGCGFPGDANVFTFQREAAISHAVVLEVTIRVCVMSVPIAAELPTKFALLLIALARASGKVAEFIFPSVPTPMTTEEGSGVNRKGLQIHRSCVLKIGAYLRASCVP